MPNSRKNRVKLADIAQVSGVSLTAVSLALNNKPGISQETRVRITEIARSMGYRFKVPQTQMAVTPVKTLGLLVKSRPQDEPHANSFYASIIAGIDATCRQMGVTLMFANLPVDSENCPLEMPSLLDKREVDGYLLAGVQIDEVFAHWLERRACPVVLLDSYSQSWRFSSVLSENVGGAYQVTEYLIQKGHREIGFIGGHDRAFPSLVERRTGYRKAMARYGLQRQVFADCSPNRKEAGAAALSLLRQNPRLTALVGVNDDTAISAMHALIEAGYRVPQDISLVGFDDICLAESVVPTLTTLRVAKPSMGRLAVQLLLNQIFQPAGGRVTAMFRPVLIERNSAAAVV